MKQQRTGLFDCNSDLPSYYGHHLKDGAKVVQDRVEREHCRDDVGVSGACVLADEDLLVGAHAFLQVPLAYMARAAQVVPDVPWPLLIQ